MFQRVKTRRPPLKRPRQRPLDSAVTDILRQEAQRESALRAAESSGLETQPELGLTDPPADDLEARAQQTRERMARLRGEAPEAPQQEAAPVGARSERLPDIEEINTSLRSDQDGGILGDSAQVVVPPRRKRGFLRGFAVSVVIAVALVMVYQNADEIAVAVPEAEPHLATYVDWVNQTRVWLHTQAELLALQPDSN